MGLGAGQIPGHWHAPILSTARGASDPLTDIPPALATMKLVAPTFGEFVNSQYLYDIGIIIEEDIGSSVLTDDLRIRRQGNYHYTTGALNYCVFHFQNNHYC